MKADLVALQQGRARRSPGAHSDLAEALMDLVHEVPVISPAGDDELPGLIDQAGRLPFPATARGRSRQGCPAGLGAKRRVGAENRAVRT